MDSDFKNRFWFLATVFLFFCLLLTPLGNFNDWVPPTTHTGFYSIKNIDPGDDTGYYAYLRSGIIDVDLDFANERNYAHSETFMPTGYVFNNWQIGQSILFLPFFLIGHFLAFILKNFGFKISTDGYSLPYYISTAIASHTYLFVGLLQLNRIVKRISTEKIATLVTISIWLCSPLIYFSFIRQRMAHTTEFFMAVMFISLWLKIRESEEIKDHALLGCLLGLLCIVRIINISFFSIYLIDQINLIRQFFLKNKSLPIISFLKKLLWMLLFFLITISPQLFIWYKFNGMPLPIRHFEMASVGLTSVLAPETLKKLLNIFFSFKWGLCFSFTIFIFAIIGLHSDPRLKQIRISVVTYLIIMTLIVLIYPENSDSYGERHFISAIPLLAIGLAGILNWASNKKTKLFWFISISIIGVCFIIQYCMIAQYKIIILHNDPEYSLNAIKNIPKLLFEYPNFLLRSSNWFRLLTLDHQGSWNIKDFLLLLVFPILQLGVLFIIYFSFSKISKLKQIFNFKQNFLLTFICTSVIFFFFLITFLIPAKTPEEIQNRNYYAKLLKQANRYLDKNNLDQAFKYYNMALNQGLPSLTPNLQLGLIQQSKNNFTESNKYFQNVLKMDPNHQIARVNLGDNFNILGDYGNAEKNLKIAINNQSPMPEAFDALGQVYAKQNRLAIAEIMFKVSIALKSNYGNGHLNLAILFTKIGNKKKAIYHLKETIRLGIINQTATDLSVLYGLRLKK